MLTVFALRFAPLTLGSYCSNPVSQVTLARTLSWCSVFGKGLLSLARGHVLITHCDFGPYTERTTPFGTQVRKDPGDRGFDFCEPGTFINDLETPGDSSNSLRGAHASSQTQDYLE